MNCFLCQKHAGKIASPPGGYIYEGTHWRVCHAPIDKTASYGPLLKKLFTELKSVTSVERVYQVIMLEGVPHFHAWLVPRVKEIFERGIAFLEKDYTCNESDAIQLAARLRETLSQA